MQSFFNTVGVAGVGLIGGSMAMALKSKTDLTVLGWDKNSATLEAALSSGTLDEAGGDISRCNLLFVALYPQAAVDFVRAHATALRPGSVVVDLCGIKRYLCGELTDFCRERGLHFLGAHPMAGRETSGFTSATPGLYEGASVILTPDEGLDARVLEDVKSLLGQVGFGRVICTTPQRHDEMIAYTSQLAHILSSAYIQNPLSAAFEGFSAFTGGSFQDLTRVARLNCDMWGELFLRNSDMLCNQLDLLIEKLIDYKKAIRGGDAKTLRRLMEEGTAIKEQLLDELDNAE